MWEGTPRSKDTFEERHASLRSYYSRVTMATGRGAAATPNPPMSQVQLQIAYLRLAGGVALTP